MNITIRKHPRTLQEAFGPYTDSVIHEPRKTLFRWLRFRAEQAKPSRALREVSKQR